MSKIATTSPLNVMQYHRPPHVPDAYGTYWGLFPNTPPYYHVRAQASPAFDLSPGYFNISFDFQATSFAAPMTAISKDDSAGSQDWRVQVQDGTTITFSTDGGAQTLSATVPAMSTSTWYNVIVEMLGGTLTIYLDNVSYATSGSITVTNNPAGQVTIGCQAWNSPAAHFYGILDNINVYDSNPALVLSTGFELLEPGNLHFVDENNGQPLTIYPAPPTTKTPEHYGIVTDGLIVHFDTVNLNSYDRNNPPVADILDLTANANDGTISGTTDFTADGGVHFDGVDGKLTYNFDAPGAMTHIVFAKSNQPTWSDYNGLGANREPGGWSMHTWQSSTDISFGWNGPDGSTVSTTIMPTVDIQTPHMYAITTDGTDGHAYIDATEYPMFGTMTTRDPLTNLDMYIANDAPPYNSRFTEITLYVHLVYNRKLTKAEMLQNYNALKTFA